MVFLPARPPTFEAALRDVGARSADARLAAARRLASPPEARAAEAREGLLRLLDDPVLSVRAAAVLGIAEVGDARCLPIVLARFDDGDPGVREAAVIAAGRIGGDEAIAAIREALGRGEPEIRFQAIASLAEAAPAEAAALLPLIDDDDPEVRAQTAAALGELDASHAADALAALLDDLDARPRREAALALAAFGDPRGEGILCEALDDPERAIEAALALGEVGGEQAREALAAVAGRFFVSLHLKAAAGAALARLGDERGPAAIRSVLRAMRSDGRSFAAELVGRYGLRELGPDLDALLAAPRGADPAVVRDALASLGRGGGAS